MKSSLVYIAFAFTILACGQNSDNKKLYDDSQPRIATGKLISINFTDTNYVEVQAYARDTATENGWNIKYFVKDDSTRYNDLYIQWTKDGDTGLYYGGNILMMRRYFIPRLKGENSTHIFLTHGCATNCSALLTLSKDKSPKAIDYSYVLKYDMNYGRLVYIPERSFSTEILEVSVMDLNTQKEKSVIFKNNCSVAAEQDCIDSISFDKNKVFLLATLIDKNDKSKLNTIKETHTIVF